MAIAFYPRTSPPVDGASSRQFLTFGGVVDGGTFTPQLNGEDASPVAWDADSSVLAANLLAALQGIAAVGLTGVTITADSPLPGSFTLDFAGPLARTAVPLLVVSDNSLTGTSPTVSTVESIVGVAPDPMYPVTGAMATVSTPPGAIYINVGNPLSPSWSLQ